MPSFKTPEGWEMPTDATPGQPFQAVGTFVADEAGNLTLMEIDGSPIEGYEEPEMEGEETEIEIEVGGKKKPAKNEEGMTGPEEMMMRAQKAGLF
jgi:hypothetical protein